MRTLVTIHMHSNQLMHTVAFGLPRFSLLIYFVDHDCHDRLSEKGITESHISTNCCSEAF